MQTVNIHEAKTHLSRYLERVAQEDEMIIARTGHPLARLVPYETALPPRVLGLGEATIPVDFDRMAEAEIANMFEEDGV